MVHDERVESLRIGPPKDGVNVAADLWRLRIRGWDYTCSCGETWDLKMCSSLHSDPEAELFCPVCIVESLK